MRIQTHILPYWFDVSKPVHNTSLGELEIADNQYSLNGYFASSSTGKEKDSETGFYYFGARYYDPTLSGLFLSVDPMADQYPSLSPYAYCAWNPVKIVDPDGREIDEYRLNVETGELYFYKETDDAEDCIHSGYYTSGGFWVDGDNSFSCPKGILSADRNIDNSKIHLFASEYDGLSLMQNISFACYKEITAYAFFDKTTQMEIFPWADNTSTSSQFLRPEKVTLDNIMYDVHTHCGTVNYYSDGSGTFSPSDVDIRTLIDNPFRNWPHYILSRKQGLGQFDVNGKKSIDPNTLDVSLKRFYQPAYHGNK